MLEILAQTGSGTISERYDFGTAIAAAHLPSGGHGFTGLRYLTHPTSGSELQYFCGGYDASTDFSDEAFSQSTPGPAAPASSTISCALTLTDATGAVLSNEVLVVDSATPRSASVGEFSFEARRVAGEYDSGGIMIDASMPGVPRLLHSLYQTHGGDVPMNLVQGPSFTGERTLTEPGGSTLTYACRTDQS